MESMVEVHFFFFFLHMNVQQFYCHLLQTQSTIFSTLNCLCTFVWAYLWILFSVPLIYLSVSMPTLGCLDYNSVIINHNIFIVYKMPFASDSSISTHPFSHKMVTINDSSQVTNWEMAEANSWAKTPSSVLLPPTDLSPRARGVFYSQSTGLE